MIRKIKLYNNNLWNPKSDKDIYLIYLYEIFKKSTTYFDDFNNFFVKSNDDLIISRYSSYSDILYFNNSLYQNMNNLYLKKDSANIIFLLYNYVFKMEIKKIIFEL